MEASILIVSRNRRTELSRTLKILHRYVDEEVHEIRVFLDGCTDDSESLKQEFPEVHWMYSEKRLGASRARNVLYKTARGNLLFGFDDDAHPLQSDFIKRSEKLFKEYPKLAIIGFKEIKGNWSSDNDIPLELIKVQPDFLVNDFVGCGFVIKKSIYDETRGFPAWIDIYGEEWCVALEVLEKGYNILYTYSIQVNHRIEKTKRGKEANYFRFGKQLKNTSYFYMVYYPFPLFLKKIFRLYILNFKKYGLKDRKFFQKFWVTMFENVLNLRKIWKERNPVHPNTLATFNNLSKPLY
ncbi:glycosyltransferase family 2 protein [Autumnicola musiva]|uniref:Glycosyltransferase n=1 Tax=Autumnicola musiva TaxID=3075589 RepID=A0ABU3D5I3_9FLAO|nr:glycosyltransferase [Zunongwangia sp. F117]MDT0676795.1 glycosyltransferase [Zunongwangia sp. F117]